MKPIMYTLVLLALSVSTAALAQDPDAFIILWRASLHSKSITIGSSYSGETYYYTVSWGDGSTDTNQTGRKTHTYSASRDYKVTITGRFPRVDIHPKSQVMEVQQWGTQKWTSMAWAFSGCHNLKITARDNPDLSVVKDMTSMFSNATSFNQSLNSWNVSNVTNMEAMFMGATSFNQPLNDWNVSKVSRMYSMFSGATSFNRPLNDWNVSSVTDMGSMFWGAKSVSAENYTRLLIGWAKQTGLPSGVVFGAPPNGYYCRAAAAREQLTDTYGWVITDDKGAIGLAPGVPPPKNNDPSFKSSSRLTTPPPVSAPLITPPPFSKNAIHEVGKFEASDADGHPLSLKLVAHGYNPADYGLSLDITHKAPGDKIAATLNWNTDCLKFPALHAKNDFGLSVELEDDDVCREHNQQIIRYRLKTINTNAKPVLTTTLHFPRTKGKGQATATLTWQPECSLLGEGFAPKAHTVRFLAKDHHCMAPRADTLALTLNVKQEVTTTFHPENAFSPNGDGINDTFKLHGHQDPAYNLPKDCRHGAFRSILMINRSGQKLYRSSNRNFEWDGEGVKTGGYYYHIEYEHQSYQGVVHVFR